MAIQLFEKLGDGGFGDVWRGEDTDLHRPVAVKIIRPEAMSMVDAKTHAQALARANHSNVVQVFKLDKIQDPDTKLISECIVMELIEGETLEKHISHGPLNLSELRRIGLGIINGLEHIHQQGLAHGDLHEQNVMVTSTGVKILDILYLGTMKILATSKKEERIKRDLLSARLLLQQLIGNSELDSAEATEFNGLLAGDPNIDDIRKAFNTITEPESAEDMSRKVDHVYSRFDEEAFDESEEYAVALADSTQKEVTYPLFLKIVDKESYDPKHRRYVRLIWERLTDVEKSNVIHKLGEKLESEIPKGRFWPPLRLLNALGAQAWGMLPKLQQLRTENLIVNDVLAGHLDIFNPSSQKGILGTYSLSLYKFFSPARLQKLAENLLSLLHQNWYTQNYVGKFFLTVIPEIANLTGSRDKFLIGMAYAYRNDARVIKQNFDGLPDDWKADIIAINEARKIKDNDDMPF